MITKIDHIGIAVHSIEKSAPLYREVFGMAFDGEEVVEEQGVKVAFFKAGETMVELLEPISEESPIARFLEKNGEGVHHVALGCDDIHEARTQVAEKGIRLLSDAPREGAHGKIISFMHPKDTGRVLMELAQPKKEE